MKRKMQYLYNISALNISHFHRNISLNETFSGLPGSSYIDTVFIIVHVSILVVGTFGNTAVLYYIGIKNKHKKDYDIQIISLAIADELSSIVTTLSHIFSFTKKSWHNNLIDVIACKLIRTMFHLTLLVSALMLVLISITRFRVIHSSKRCKTKRWKSLLQVFIVWIIALSVLAPYMHTTSVKEGWCTNTSWTLKDLFLFTNVYYAASYVIPLILMTALYSVSTCRLKRRRVPDASITSFTKRQRQTDNITTMFQRIVIVFFTLTTPYMVYDYVMYYHLLYKMNTWSENYVYFSYTGYVTFSLVSLNSCVNPFIYSRMHHKMNSFIKSLCLANIRNKSRKGYNLRTTLIRNTSEVGNLNGNEKKI